ncbi:MAG: pyridoxamine 5'-phosphate oxidase family protein [Gammaproteobacteria bacterium]
MSSTRFPHTLGEDSPFHAGEKLVQQRVGVHDTVEPRARRMIRAELTAQHRDFYPLLPFLVVAARDACERPWATLLTGPPGFARAADVRHLDVGARPLPGDALEQTLVEGAAIGVLGIDLETRRRNRVNGKLVASGAGGIRLAVGQAFGNCPQYIHPRAWRVETPTPGAPSRGTTLTSRQRAFVAQADTCFLASGYGNGEDTPAHGLDASHRGGPPGFVTVASERELELPDFAGNKHFNTLGNLLLDARIGATFVDFAHGDLLQLSGRAQIDWSPSAAARADGAERLLHITIEQVNELPGALPLRFDDVPATQRTPRICAA